MHRFALPPFHTRGARCQELSQSDLNCLVEEKKNGHSTKKATKVILPTVAKKQSDKKDLVTSKVKLAAVLRNFYAEARKKNEELNK